MIMFSPILLPMSGSKPLPPSSLWFPFQNSTSLLAQTLTPLACVRSSLLALVLINSFSVQVSGLCNTTLHRSSQEAHERGRGREEGIIHQTRSPSS